MMFARFWTLNFFWMMPLVAFILLIHGRQKRKILGNVADPELLDRLTGREIRGRGFLKGLFLMLGIGSMIFALAGPRWGSHYQEVQQKGVDIMILVDVSPSMMVEDVKPNRLERARREILDHAK